MVLMDTSEEFTITWMSNEHVHTYGAIPNGKDETNHWKECTDPACPDKAHSKIEVEVHKDNTADNKCDICGADVPVPPPAHTHDHGTIWKSDEGEHWNECACGDQANKAAHTDSNNDGKCDTCGKDMPTTPGGDEPGTESGTDEPGTDDPNAGNTEDPTDNGCGGCGSSFGAGAAIIVAICGLAVFMIDKKKKH